MRNLLFVFLIAAGQARSADAPRPGSTLPGQAVNADSKYILSDVRVIFEGDPPAIKSREGRPAAARHSKKKPAPRAAETKETPAAK